VYSSLHQYPRGGVPFYSKSWKALNERKAEVVSSSGRSRGIFVYGEDCPRKNSVRCDPVITDRSIDCLVVKRFLLGRIGMLLLYFYLFALTRSVFPCAITLIVLRMQPDEAMRRSVKSPGFTSKPISRA
jgi:hypothetical protein